MSAERFIEMLEDRKLVSDRLLVKLREKVAEAKQPLPATALARFLVQKKHLSQQQVLDVLSDLPDEEAEPDEKEEDFRDDSSIFAPLFKRKKSKRDEPTGAPGSEKQDKVTPAALEKRNAAEQPPAKPDLGGLTPTQNLEELSASKSSHDNHRKLMDDPLVADVTLASGSNPLRSPSSVLRLKRKSDADVAKRLTAKAHRQESKRHKKKRKKARKSEWDSPLILAGGGILALLVLCALLVTWMLRWESGDELLREAQMARDEGSFTQAISNYERFLERFPGHSEHGLARVELVLVRLRQATEVGNYPLALEIAEQELGAVEEEERFDEAQGELAALLPRIARGLADQAEAAGDPTAAGDAVEMATTALTLCSNTMYIPRSLRDDPELAEVQRVLDRVARRQKSHQGLQQGLQAMEEAVAAGDTRAAYDVRRQLVDEYPTLASDAQLAAMVAKTSAAEQAGIRFVAEEQKPQTTDRPVPWTAALVVAQRRRAATGGGTSGTVSVRVDGAVYGLDTATGEVLWRRYVSFAPAAPPQSIGDDVLVIDASQHELLCLESRTGRLQWRQEFGAPIAAPLVVGGRTFVAAESGRLYVVDSNSGICKGYLQFPQPLRVPPAVDRRGEQLYLTGDHSSLYSISLSDLTCLGVYYLGHSEGSIRVPPALVRNRVAVLENDGVETCRLHLLSLDEQGAIAEAVTDRRLAGLATAPPLVMGRRLVTVTDRGQMDVFDVTENNGNAALISVATRTATSRQPLERHVAMTEDHIWVGGAKLTRYGILPTGNRLPVAEVEDNFAGATFDHPFQLSGKTLVHVRRPAGRAGFAVTAVETSQARTLWETDLAVPPAWSPIVDASAPALVVGNANGSVFRIGEQEIRSRVQNEVLEARSAPAQMPALTSAVELGAGRAAFMAATASDKLLLYDPSAERNPLQWVTLPSRLACAVSPFGDGLVAPLEVGQVYYLDPSGGQPLAAPFQPRLQPRKTVRYQPAGTVDQENRQFVITDGREKIYLVALVDRPQPHLAAVTEAMVGPDVIVSPIVVVGEMAYAVTEGIQLVRYRLPTLERAGEVDLPEEVLGGPYRAGRNLLLVTTDDQLTAVTADGTLLWSVPLEHGDLAGPPLADDDGILLAYRRGILERRATSDGQALKELDVQQPLAAGPVRFQRHVVLAAHDGTLLVVDPP